MGLKLRKISGLEKQSGWSLAYGTGVLNPGSVDPGNYMDNFTCTYVCMQIRVSNFKRAHVLPKAKNLCEDSGGSMGTLLGKKRQGSFPFPHSGPSLRPLFLGIFTSLVARAMLHRPSVFLSLIQVFPALIYILNQSNICAQF